MTPTTNNPINGSAEDPKRVAKKTSQNGWIRWPGLIAFVVITLIIAASWYLLGDWIVKKGIETAGTKAVGAKVEVAKADMNFFPVGLTLEGFQVTNPNAPMTNALEIARMVMILELSQLIRHRVVVNMMQMEGMRFNTPRKTSGALPEKARRQDAEKKAPSSKTQKKGGHLQQLQKMGCGNFQLPSFEKPDLKNLLAKEHLQSIELAEKLEADLKAEKAYWDKALKELPDEKKLRDYEDKLKGLTSKKNNLGSLLGKAGNALTVQKEIQADLNRIKAAQQRFKKYSRELESRVQNLAKAPMADVRRLQANYSLNADGLANLSQLLIGGQLCDHWQTAWQWFRRLKPYIQNQGAQSAEEEAQTAKLLRGKGVYVRFAEKTPLPTFLIRQAKASIALQLGNLSGKIANLNSDPPLLGHPTTVNVLGRNLATAKSLSLSALIDLVTPGKPSGQIQLGLSDYKLKEIALSRDKALPVTVKTALANVAADFNFEDELIDIEVDMDFNKVELTTGARSSDNAVQAALMDSLADIHQFDLVASIKGQVDDYRMKVHSSLDQTLKNAVGKLAKKEAARLSAQIEDRVRQKTAAPLAKVQQQMKILGPVGDKLKKLLNQGSDLLKSSDLRLPL